MQIFDKVKKTNNNIYYTYILFSKTRNLQENIDWSELKEENVPIFVPPITFGKVLKIYTGDTFVLATKIPFFHETIETAQICKFTIHLDSVTAPIDKENGSITKEALTQKIEHQVVQLRNVSTDRHGKIYAKVFLAEENVNEWLLKNNYVVKSKNGKKRRMSESDSILSAPSVSLAPSIKHYSCKDIIPENANTNTLTIDNFILPSIQRQNTNLSTASASIKTDCFLSHNWGDQNKNHNFVKKVNLELNTKSRPICIQKDALYENFPFQDLYVSPEHSLLIENHMIVASNIINGNTIYQDEECTEVEYYHVECRDHCAIYANGILAESYFEANNRNVFDRVSDILYKMT